MLLKFCSIVVLGLIVMLRLVKFRLCVVLVMLSVMLMASGVVFRLFASLSVMLNVGSVVSIPVTLTPLMVAWMSWISSVWLW